MLIVLSLRANHIAVCTVSWLAAFAILVQSFPATSCRCMRSGACSQQVARSQGCCCRAELVRSGRCCCARPRAESDHSCCDLAKHSPDSGCTCGVNCQCGKAQREPATPPVENAPQEKVTGNAPSPSTDVAVDERGFQSRSDDGPVDSFAFTSLGRCARLCRFTL